MERTLVYCIHKEKTIQEFLREQGFSRHIMIQLKKIPQSVLVEGIWQRFHYRLQPGQTLRIRYTEEGNQKILPVPLPLHIVYEDEDILILDKPSNMPVHPSQGNYENTLANGLAYYFKEKGESFIFRCANRLDRDTTGLLAVAKHGISACILSRLMKEHQVQREYYAVVSGKTPPIGRIDAPIGRAEGSTIERKIDFVHGERAVTHYRTVCYENGHSLLAIRLETGRTHQIRVHMKYIGHPLPGDFLYCPDYRIIKRQALHSARLTFPHPITGKQMTFTSEFPKDFQNFFSLHMTKSML